MTSEDYKLYLDGIEIGARMAARNARMLPNRPDFETRAEDELANAHQALAAALEQIVTAQAEFRSKAVA